MAENKLEDIKSVLKSFVMMRIVQDEQYPFIIHHPIFENIVVPIKNENGYTVVDILTEDGHTQVVNQYFNLIDSMNSLSRLYEIVSKNYKLVFLKYIKEYLSKDDFAELLAQSWIIAENPNDDINVSKKTLIRWFKKANKTALMTQEDYKKYLEFPEKVKIYRGVSKGRVTDGLSWTDDLDVAKWFANRFSKDGDILVAEVDKENILAYFNTRNEREVVTDVYKINYEYMK